MCASGAIILYYSCITAVHARYTVGKVPLNVIYNLTAGPSVVNGSCVEVDFGVPFSPKTFTRFSLTVAFVHFSRFEKCTKALVFSLMHS
jgi:hypothetical protein